MPPTARRFGLSYPVSRVTSKGNCDVWVHQKGSTAGPHRPGLTAQALALAALPPAEAARRRRLSLAQWPVHPGQLLPKQHRGGCHEGARFPPGNRLPRPRPSPVAASHGRKFRRHARHEPMPPHRPRARAVGHIQTAPPPPNVRGNRPASRSRRLGSTPETPGPTHKPIPGPPRRPISDRSTRPREGRNTARSPMRSSSG